MASFALPPSLDANRPQLDHWAGLIQSGRAAAYNEQELLPGFLTDFFTGLLGYREMASAGEGFTLRREKHIEAAGTRADAVLGRFGTNQDQAVVALEGKGPKDPLERPYAGRRLSAVDQGYLYAVGLACDWILITNIREIRLYHKGSDQRTYERFDTARLAVDEAALRRFVFLLGAERIVPDRGRSHLYDLLEASEKADLELTRAFYADYAGMRRSVHAALCQANPDQAPERLLFYTQKLLDRVLFAAFCEDRGLLPEASLRKAFTHADPYNPHPVWDNFRGLFRAIDQGNPTLGIPAYNGGLFAPEAALDGLIVPDAVCALFKRLGDYDYRPPGQVGYDEEAPTQMVDVEILGHIFEQSITDLEQIRAALSVGEAGPAAGKADGSISKVSRRKREGAFYTPRFVTRYLVEEALGPVLAERFERLRAAHHRRAAGTARRALDDPRAYDLAALNAPQRRALALFWQAWLGELQTVRLVDPACGSGAFLIEAFDQLHAHYEQALSHLEELRGQRSLFDPDRGILQHNLFGVDLNAEAVEICRLSIWIKTAQRGKRLTDLDATIRVGNSVVSDAEIDARALDWEDAFPDVFAGGGFDVVVSNPPYVRQELLSAVKPYLAAHYASYHGMADLYVYFYELGMRLLRPGGRLSYIVTNKWMKAGYGEPLRRFFSEAVWMESVVNFGHAKQFFPDADVFPSIVVARKPNDELPPEAARVCDIPRDQVRIDDLAAQIEEAGFELPRVNLGAGAWSLEPPGVLRLMEKIRAVGVPLQEFAGVKPLCGIKTGFNKAFLIDNATKEDLVRRDPRCADVIKPYLRGQDVKRWHPKWEQLWMIVLKSSSDQVWPWSETGESAEAVFAQTYSSIHEHLKGFEPQLRKRYDQGRYWWELRPCAFYDDFEKPKIWYQAIQFHSVYGFDRAGLFGNNKTYFVATDDLYLVSVLNTPLMWWHNWRYLIHLKDEALSVDAVKMVLLPIAEPSDEIRAGVEAAATRLIDTAKAKQDATRDLVDWLRMEYDLEKPGKKLQTPFDLDSDAFAHEVRKRRGKNTPLSSAGLRALRGEYAATIEPMRRRLNEAAGLEHRLSDLVNAAYGLTEEEVDLMWRTAPPRMPIAR